MATKETINIEVKSDIKEASKDAAGLASEFNIMGVSLNSVKASMAKIIPTAKAMFGTIKAGIASTGIGLLVIALGSVATFFTKTKKGAELLEVAFTGIGAAVSVIVDRVAKFGGAIVKLFKGDVKGAFKDVKGAFTGIGEEIANDVKEAMALKKAFQALRDSERELNVETAQRRADIEALKLIAEDVSKTETERLAAAKAAFKIENDLLDDRIANAEEAVRIQEQQNAINENMEEDLDALAEKEINLANIRGESITKQIELNNKINAIEAEVAAKRAERNQAKLDEIAAEKKASEDLYIAQMAQAAAFEARVKILADKEKAIAKDLENFKKSTIQQGFGAAAAMAGENVALSKGVAAAQTIFNTQQGIMAALGATSVADKLLPYPLRLANAISVGIMGTAALAKIMSTDPSGGGAGPGPTTTTAAAPPSPQMMSGAFELTGGQPVEPTRAYVVSDDITNSQNGLEIIRRRATI